MHTTVVVPPHTDKTSVMVNYVDRTKEEKEDNSPDLRGLEALIERSVNKGTLCIGD